MSEFDGVLFSDLHLSETSTRRCELFEAFVKRVEGTPEVACLGDLVEYWIGYQHLRIPHGAWIFEMLKRVAKDAKRAIWVPGNRDFLMNRQAKWAGFKVCRNRYEGEFCGRRVALEHGDRFCTLDVEYQRFRAWFRRLPWTMLEYIITEKRGHRMALNLRKRSKGEIVRKNPSAFGIQSLPIERLVFRGAEVIVCGHVHTPFSRNYQGAKNIGRLHVMGDWHDDGAVVCTVKDGEFKLQHFDGDRFTDFEAPEQQELFSPTLDRAQV